MAFDCPFCLTDKLETEVLEDLKNKQAKDNKLIDGVLVNALVRCLRKILNTYPTPLRQQSYTALIALLQTEIIEPCQVMPMTPEQQRSTH